jgi:hypothetical protein
MVAVVLGERRPILEAYVASAGIISGTRYLHDRIRLNESGAKRKSIIRHEQLLLVPRFCDGEDVFDSEDGQPPV